MSASKHHLTHTSPTRSLRGELVTVRLPGASDTEPLAAILAQPEVAEWWVGYTHERIERELIRDHGSARIIEVAGATAGALLVIRSDDPEYPTTVMHIFIGTEFRGQRIGEEALALAIREEFAHGIQRITLDPNIRNEGAIRSYERLGFRRVGVLREYQLRPNGAMEDGVLLDLTRGDFPEGPPLPDRGSRAV